MGHWGGQLTWEVKDSERMVVCWRSAMVLARAGVDINTMRAWRMSPRKMTFENGVIGLTDYRRKIKRP